MTYESFNVQFDWNDNRREIMVRTRQVEDVSPVIATYEVLWHNTHLFTIYPTFNNNCCKVWKILEEERESYLPYGFIAALGNIIENVYVMN